MLRNNAAEGVKEQVESIKKDVDMLKTGATEVVNYLTNTDPTSLPKPPK